MNHNENINRIKAVYSALEDLGDKVVFVGGATVSLYKDRPAAETRSTEDVDIIIEVAKYADYTDIEEQLRKKGFVNDIESNVICRYKINEIIVDIMPTAENILGFNNRWYPDGFKYSMAHIIDEEITVRVLKPEYFIASKLDAYNSRGGGDGRMSSDFEDIVYVLNNRNTIWDEMKAAPEDLRIFLKDEFANLLKQQYIFEWVSAHLEYIEQRRANFLIEALVSFTTEQA